MGKANKFDDASVDRVKVGSSADCCSEFELIFFNFINDQMKIISCLNLIVSNIKWKFLLLLSVETIEIPTISLKVLSTFAVADDAKKGLNWHRHNYQLFVYHF